MRTFASPASTQDVVELVNDARTSGQKLRPIGAGHSFTPIAKPVDVQVKMSNMSGIEVDSATNRVRIKAGTHLYELVELLTAKGLALPNMGDIDRQTISGAVSTSTHGTGLKWTGFGGAVVGGEMVTGTGEVFRWSEGGENSDMVPALGVTLGALGILTEAEMQCVPSFCLEAKEAPSTMTTELGHIDATLENIDHYEFFWFPHTDKVMTKRNTRLPGDAELSPLSPRKAKWEDDFLSNTAFKWICEAVAKFPKLAPYVNRVSASALSARTFSDLSHKVYASPRDVRFTESELAVPREAAEPILRELQRWHERNTDAAVAFPVEVRWTAADDRWMSTAHGRESCYIAIHQFHKGNDAEYFKFFWDLGREYDARPHWGKMHDYDAEYFRTVYPKFDEFVALRERFDPQRVFTNPYLDQVLGK